MKKILSILIVLTLTLSFTVFASGFEFKSASYVDGTTSAYIYGNVISLTFSEEVDGGSLGDITVKKDGEALAVTQYTVDHKLVDPDNGVYDEKIVEVTIDEDPTDATTTLPLSYGATYEIDYTDAKNYLDSSVTNIKKTLTFTVEEEPEVKIGTPELIAGIETGTITHPVNVTYNTLMGFMVDVENGSGSDKNITLVCALYDANGLLKKIVTSSKEIASGETESIAVGTFIDEKTDTLVNFEKVRLFVWDTMANKSPYVAAYNYNITTP